MQTSCKFNTAVNVDSTSKLGLSNSDNIENQNQGLSFSSSIVCEVKSNETRCVDGASTTNTPEASQQLFSEFNKIPSLILKIGDTPAIPETNQQSQFNQVATISILSDHSSETDESNLPTSMWERLSQNDLSFVQNSATSNFEQWSDDYNYHLAGTSLEQAASPVDQIEQVNGNYKEPLASTSLEQSASPMDQIEQVNGDYKEPLASTLLEQSASLLHQSKQMNGEYKAPRIQAAVDTNLDFPNLKIKQSIAQFSETRSNLDANLAYISSTDDASNTQNFSGSTSEPSKYSETKTFSHVLKFHETTWKQQVSNRIVETLASGKQDLELVIAPKSLGKIAIHVSSSGDILNLTIAADNLKTASLLSAALPEIENNLKDSGIGVLSTKLGSNGAHAEQEQNNEKSEAEPSTRFHGQSTESEDDEGAQKIGAVSYHTGKYSYEV